MATDGIHAEWVQTPRSFGMVPPPHTLLLVPVLPVEAARIGRSGDVLRIGNGCAVYHQAHQGANRCIFGVNV